MKVFRFMSIDEFRKYMLGYTLINNTNHHLKYNNKTNSVGFCFFNLDDFKPEEVLHCLTGIVRCQICVIFEVENSKLIKSWGRYRKFSSIMDNGINVFRNYDELIKSMSFIATEYCTKEYEKNTFKLIKYAIPDWYNTKKWEWRDFKDVNL